MKKGFYILLAALMMLPAGASAQQNLRTGYFLDGYIYKYKMNPAMAPERGFFAMPVLGNIGLGVETNLGLSTFVYPTSQGGLTTFLSPRVSSEDFLKNIADNNKLNLNVDMSILSFGFRTGKSYHTVDLSTKINTGANVPGGLFEFIKVGGSQGNTIWDVSNLGLRGMARAELSYGYSRSIGDALRVGGRAKLLLGIMNFDVNLDKMSFEMSSEKWAVESHGNMMISAPFTFGTKENNLVDFSSLDTYNLVSNLMSPSMGFAIDLGATYDFLDYFTASLSVLDLGAVSWKNTLVAATPETSWYFDGFDSVDMSTMGDQVSGLFTGLTGAFNFEKQESGVKKSSALAATINAGVEARMPFYERLSFGLLYHQKIEGVYSYSEGRLAVTVSPTNWFSLTTNYALSNFGHSWGGALNLHLPGFGLFVGVDSFGPLLNVTPQMVPINAVNTNLAFGLNFTFGKYHGRFMKKVQTQTEEL